MFPNVVVEGRKARLRPVIKDDLPFFVQWLSDLDINKWLALPLSGHPSSLEEEQQWFERTMLDSFQLVWSTETKEGTLLGNIALHPSVIRPDSAEIGLFIGNKSLWNQGYGTDVVQTLLGHAFQHMGLRRVYLHTDVENHGAHRCFEKSGFRREGLVKEYRRRWYDARFIDGVLMAILAGEFVTRE